jgi:hypothetical protein
LGCRTWDGFEIVPDGTRLYVSQKAGGVSRRALGPTAPQRRVVSASSAPCTDGSHVYGTVTEALAVANPGAECVSVDQAVRLESFAGPSHTYLRSVTVTGDSARVAGFRLHALQT